MELESVICDINKAGSLFLATIKIGMIKAAAARWMGQLHYFVCCCELKVQCGFFYRQKLTLILKECFLVYVMLSHFGLAQSWLRGQQRNIWQHLNNHIWMSSGKETITNGAFFCICIMYLLEVKLFNYSH